MNKYKSASETKNTKGRFKHGEDLLNKSRNPKALKGSDKEVHLDQNDADYCYRRGRVIDKLGQYEEAVEFYDQAIKISPEYANYWYHRGNAKFNLEQYKKAIKDFDQAIKIKQD